MQTITYKEVWDVMTETLKDVYKKAIEEYSYGDISELIDEFVFGEAEEELFDERLKARLPTELQLSKEDRKYMLKEMAYSQEKLKEYKKLNDYNLVYAWRGKFLYGFICYDGFAEEFEDEFFPPN
jgi:hypothetical protein